MGGVEGPHAFYGFSCGATSGVKANNATTTGHDADLAGGGAARKVGGSS
jgi:hypothetical protein